MDLLRALTRAAGHVCALVHPLPEDAHSRKHDAQSFPHKRCWTKLHTLSLPLPKPKHNPSNPLSSIVYLLKDVLVKTKLNPNLTPPLTLSIHGMYLVLRFGVFGVCSALKLPIMLLLLWTLGYQARGRISTFCGDAARC